MSDPLLGKVISERYRLTEVLGQGGMGIVFKAEDLRLNNRLCAVKLLKGQTTDPHEAKRFEAELQIISRLRSPHVVQVLDTGYFEGHRLYIVMELLEGEPLSNLSTREGALTLPRSIQITKGILAGLSEAHEYGIVHRDLKPANIFITRSRAGDEITKVLDFGIAKDINSDEATGLTSASMIIGTPKYMAPEQFMKQPTDVRTDIYAVGLLLYQLVAGEPPFLPNNDQIPATLAMMPAEFKVGWLHLNAEPRPLAIPEDLWALIASMIAKDPSARPSSVTQIIDQLNMILSQMSQQTGAFASVHTPSGGVYADHSGPVSSSGSRAAMSHGALSASGQRAAPALTTGQSTGPTPSYPAQQEATTGVPFVGSQLSQPASKRGGGLKWALVAAALAGVAGVGAWQSGVGRQRAASSEMGECDLTILVTRPAQGARITLKDPKHPKRSMILQSGKAFKTRCSVPMEAIVRADGYVQQVTPIDMDEGQPPYTFSVSLVPEGGAKPDPALAPTPTQSAPPSAAPRQPARPLKPSTRPGARGSKRDARGRVEPKPAPVKEQPPKAAPVTAPPKEQPPKRSTRPAPADPGRSLTQPTERNKKLDF